MKVAFATSWDGKCGVAEYSKSLVSELEKRASVEIVKLDPGSVRSPARLAATLNESEVAHIQHQYSFFGGMALHKYWFPKVLDRLQVPLALTIHELDLGDTNSWPLRAYKHWFNRRIFGRPEIGRIIVHSIEARLQLTDFGIDEEIIRVIPEGVPRIGELAVDERAAKALFGVSGKRVLTIFGFIVRRKGYDLALRALKELPDDTVLLIAGGRHELDRTGFVDEIMAQIEAEGLSDRVHMTGYLPDSQIPLVMAATDIIVAPFRQIFNSASIPTSMAYGRPIVASDLPLMREMNERLPCLSLFRRGDAVDLTAKLRALLQSESRLSDASASVRTYARQWTVARAAAETVAVYEELLES